MIPKILVIEAESDLRGSLVISLIVEGYAVTGVANGALGVSLARRLTPDVIICDFRLPCLDGREIFGQLRHDQSTEKIPFILISADALPEYSVPKPDSFLRKPFGRHELMDAVLRAIAKPLAPSF